MITLHTANMDHDAMHDIYAHPKITSNGIALLEKIGANR